MNVNEFANVKMISGSQNNMSNQENHDFIGNQRIVFPRLTIQGKRTHSNTGKGANSNSKSPNVQTKINRSRS